MKRKAPVRKKRIRPKAAPSLGGLTSLVGNTPLVALPKISGLHGCGPILAKLESKNPGGSVKDRAGFRMLSKALESGDLTRDKVILDATSGNTGIAYAVWGASQGFKVRLAIPSSASEERRRILGALGAELILTPAGEGIDWAIAKVREMVAAEPGKYFYPDQYSNPENWKAHFEGTGPEIWKQTKGKITHFVAGLGTTGTFMGVGRYLKKMNKKIRIIAVQPDGPFHGLEGLKHMESSLVPGIYRDHFPDEKLFVRTEDAQARTRELARVEGLMAGISSGAALQAAIQVSKAAPKSLVVTVFPDGAEKYLSERFWEDKA